MPVAKSYQELTICGDPYEKNGRAYVVVECKNGHRKEVRFYTDSEYARMYPDSTPVRKDIKPLKEVLGFKEGYITIFKGNAYALLEWFQKEPKCRYHNFFGWYCVSEDTLPDPIPAGIEPVQLLWENVAIVEEDCLKSESLVRAEVDKLLYEPSSSTHVGAVGDRLDLVLTVTKIVELDNGFYGPKSMYIFEDKDKNIFVWSTTPRDLTIGTSYAVRGTIREHTVYKGAPQTILTRCTIK